MTSRRTLSIAITLLGLPACTTIEEDTLASAITLPTASGDDMQPGEELAVGDSLTSLNGAYTLSFESDGDLVLYRNSDRWPVWDLGSDATTGVFLMQGDGNLALYAPGMVWETATTGHPGARLIVQNDGNVVLYAADDIPLWDTGTDQTDLPAGPAATGDDLLPGETLRPGDFIRSSNKQYAFVYQLDGNLVLYRRSPVTTQWESRWDSGTFDPGGVLILQDDGNLVIYSPGAIWASHTSTAARLLVQNDGNVVLYTEGWDPVWDTGTAEPEGLRPGTHK